MALSREQVSALVSAAERMPNDDDEWIVSPDLNDIHTRDGGIVLYTNSATRKETAEFIVQSRNVGVEVARDWLQKDEENRRMREALDEIESISDHREYSLEDTCYQIGVIIRQALADLGAGNGVNERLKVNELPEGFEYDVHLSCLRCGSDAEIDTCVGCGKAICTTCDEHYSDAEGIVCKDCGDGEKLMTDGCMLSEEEMRRLRDVISCMSAAEQPWRGDLHFLYGLVDRFTRQVSEKDAEIERLRKIENAAWKAVDTVPFSAHDVYQADVHAMDALSAALEQNRGDKA